MATANVSFATSTTRPVVQYVSPTIGSSLLVYPERKADAELQIPDELRGPALYYWNKLKFFLSVLARGENLSSPINRPHNLIYNAGEA